MKLTDKEILDFVKENMTIAKDITGHIEIKKVFCSIIGNVDGDVGGNVCGNVGGDVCGNVDGDVDGDVGGNVYGIVNGS